MSKNVDKPEIKAPVTPEVKAQPQSPPAATETPPKKRFSRRLKTEAVEIENEDGKIEEWTLQELRGPQRDAVLAHIQSFIDKDTKEVNIRGNSPVAARVLSLTLIGPDGEPMDEMDALNLPAEMQDELAKQSLALSGISDKAKEQAKNA